MDRAEGRDFYSNYATNLGFRHPIRITGEKSGSERFMGAEVSDATLFGYNVSS